MFWGCLTSDSRLVCLVLKATRETGRFWSQLTALQLTVQNYSPCE